MKDLPNLDFADLGARARDAKAVFMDWDGCIAFCGRVHPQAVAFLRTHCERAVIVSNNSTDLPEDFCALLNRAGIAIPPTRIILAGVETLRIAAARNRERAMLLANRKMTRHALELGLKLARTEAELVVVLRDTRFTYRRLERAAEALQRGAALLAANPDRTHPGADGRLKPETGAILAALYASAGDAPVRKEIVGKPGPHLFWRACEVLGVTPEEAMMIGDNPDTDVAGAQALGIPAILVRPFDAVREVDARAL